MIKSYLKTTFALSLALALGGFATAYGQYEVTGTTAGGGNVVTGMGNLPPLATDDGSDILTAGGSDHLTLIIGSFASTDFFNSDYSSTITFGTPNDVFINKGTIEGATDEEESPTFGAGVDFLSNDLLHDGTLGSESISNITFVNNGNIFGANDFDDNEVVGSAVNFLATDSINGVSFTNTGLIEGASIDVFDSGFAGSAVNFITESGSISNIGFTNSGNLFGGSENDSATFMGNAVVIAGENGVYNVTINNQQNGNIVGGNENFNFDDPFVLGSGNGLIIVDFNDFGGLGGAINNVSVNNAGDILGGNDNEAGDFEEENDFASAVSNGVVIVGLGPVNNVTINNTSTGLIQGGNESDFGGFIGNGAVIASINDFDEIDNNGNVLSNVNVMNAGRILGGNNNDGDEGEGDFQGMEVGNGLVILGGTSVTNVNIVNVQGGSILGGNNNLGNDESVGSGIDITTWFGGVISNVSITNSGKIQGGSGNNDSFFVGMGIGIDGEFTNNITITNNIGGFIAGGDGNFGDSFDTGAGIAISAENLNGLNISNWGLIRGGNDISEVESNSDGGDGID
ncbi:MAG TPA: hypothetical protein VG733_12365, partial [Chthoniobacteraceae bacterium]|nr:hypothetical protein [Chthoniobacteraceae bacterium]